MAEETEDTSVLLVRPMPTNVPTPEPHSYPPPVPFNIISTADQLSIATTICNNQLEEFNKCNQIERTTYQQINTALDNDVLA